ncbi:RNA polymerase sigma factor [Dysgonomonas termitidis]|uniref:RNA polymerase sigma factor n=1 Tax=Dysgonomonas termitidis TaxID=1516126 RepID=A0ABV9KYN3_9BACT
MVNTNKYENNSKLSDEEDIKYIKSFLSGDDKAFSFMYTKYVDELLAYGISLGFDRETLKDIIQDVFYKLYFDKKILKNVIRLKFYLFKIFKNKLFDLHRSSVKTTAISYFEMSFSIKSTILDFLIGEEERKDIENHIDRLLNKITDRQRDAIYLRFIQEMEYEEIGELLDMTAPAVRKLVSRAIKRMRE